MWVKTCQGIKAAPIKVGRREHADDATGYKVRDKAYRLFDLHGGKVVISQDVFDEKMPWVLG